MRTVSQHSAKSHNPSPGPRRPGEAIAHLMKGLHHSLRQAVDEAFRMRGIDMSFAHLAALYTLQAEPGVTGAELARRSFVTAQTMNTILHRLEKDGDIERRPHPVNMRADSWFITKAGTRRLETAKAVGEEVWTRMLSAFKPGEVEQLQELLKRCIAGLYVQVEDMSVAKTVRSVAKAKRNGAKRRTARA
jgi:DNA-binding MarR family transcriptional regulator